MAIQFVKFYPFIEALCEKEHNLGSDTLKFMLSNVAPNLSWDEKADVTEISAGNGYTAGGQSVTVTTASQTNGVYTLITDPISWTASGSAIATFQYAILYNDTSTNDKLIGYIAYPYGISIPAGETFTINTDQIQGLLFGI